MFELLHDQMFQASINGETTVLKRVAQILQAVFKNSEAKNFNVKLFVLNHVFPSFVNKTLKFLSPQLSNLYL